jgi:hypothetical protein
MIAKRITVALSSRWLNHTELLDLRTDITKSTHDFYKHGMDD